MYLNRMIILRNNMKISYTPYKTALCQYVLFSLNLSKGLMKSRNWQQNGASKTITPNPASLQTIRHVIDKNKDKHNAELQRADPGKKDMEYFSDRGHIFPYNALSEFLLFPSF